MTCAFCPYSASAVCSAPVENAPKTVKAYQALQGDKVDTPQGFGVIESIRVAAEPGPVKLIFEVRNPLGMRLVAKVSEQFEFKIYRTGLCGKHACEFHHAERGPGAAVCADHWTVT